MRNYKYFQYSLPSEPPKHYVNNAISIIKDIKVYYPQFYKHFICPSEALTLSGVRAFDTYYDLGKDADPADIEGLKKLLKSHGILLVEDTYEIVRESNEEHNYSLVNTSALLEIPKHYGHLPPPGWNPPNLAAIDKDTDFYLWWFIWQFAITSHAPLDKTMREWLKKDPLAFHTITFGILLGYPGEAISSALYETEQDYDNGRVCNAKIALASAIDGAQPVYSYLKDVEENQHIKKHEELWSNILEGVYAMLEPKLASKQ